jgi:hypothetical protein
MRVPSPAATDSRQFAGHPKRARMGVLLKDPAAERDDGSYLGVHG